ncbi:hypothetical protein [Streptomyces sp. DSM 41921]|uniref:Uncharacterized protein n=1 Tax=Streptomyces dubilierae TaxID=3075533 RepID=A0ABU2PHC8_9ACTN|nr:hypothetical protein [Streptomyces sp. DSM 41921]MDT0391054.1 hypothetical protein [Streptomyces sp. DSM 41921]
MTSRDRDLSHPLEEVTGEKDVHPEEEGTQRSDRGAQSDEGRTERGDAPPEAPDDAGTP